jgi:hypothetical protein
VIRRSWSYTIHKNSPPGYGKKAVGIILLFLGFLAMAFYLFFASFK